MMMTLMTMRLKITTPISFFIAGGNKPVQPGNTESKPEAHYHYDHADPADDHYDDYDNHDHDHADEHDDKTMKRKP